MRIHLIAQDPLFESGLQSGIVNGGTAWFHHLCEAFKHHGHDAVMVDYEAPIGEADLYIIQSEWYAHASHPSEFAQARKRGAKVVVVLGHFIGGNYFPPEQIEADLFVTTWQGPLVKDFEERTGKKLHYWPHASGDDRGGVEFSGEIVFSGNTYALRDESVLNGIEVTQLKGIHPALLPAFYRGARICLNFHGAFQKGLVSRDPSAIAHLPGFALNERTFQVVGAGGFMLCEEHPILHQIFEENEVATFSDAADLRKKIDHFLAHPAEAQRIMMAGRRKIYEKHRYGHRVEQLLKWLE